MMRHVPMPMRSVPQAHSHWWQSSSLDPSNDQWEFDGSERHGGFSATPARPAPLLPRRAGRVLREVIYQSHEARELRHLAFARGMGAGGETMSPAGMLCLMHQCHLDHSSKNKNVCTSRRHLTS